MTAKTLSEELKAFSEELKAVSEELKASSEELKARGLKSSDTKAETREMFWSKKTGLCAQGGGMHEEKQQAKRHPTSETKTMCAKQRRRRMRTRIRRVWGRW